MKRTRIATGAAIVAIVGLLFNYFLWFAAEDEIIRNEPSGEIVAPDDAISVSRIVDGDTVKVFIEGEEETIRVIGINTPETVDPRKSVECFGQEASNALKEMLDTGEIVRLTADATQDDRDKYGRLLRYITDDGGQDVGLGLISQGYAYEYTYDVPYERQDAYKEAENAAQAGELGLWGDVCSSMP